MRHIACARHLGQSPMKPRTGRLRAIELPGPDSDAAPLLERARLRARAAVRPGNGGGNIPSGDGASRAWTGAVESRLRPTVPTPDRRPLWREPEPARPLLPVPGDPEAEPA